MDLPQQSFSELMGLLFHGHNSKEVLKEDANTFENTIVDGLLSLI